MTWLPFTPQRQDPEELEELTVGYDEVLATIESKLIAAATTGSKPHTLLVGPAGSGKSHVLNVALHRVERDRRYAKRAVTVRLPQDATAITRYSDLLAAVICALAPDADVPAAWQRAEVIDELIGDRVVVLVVENLDRVFADIDLEGQRSLRAWLETNRQVMLLATASTVFPEVAERRYPWFGGLNTVVLPELTIEQVQRIFAMYLRRQGKNALANFVMTKAGTEQVAALAQVIGRMPRHWVIAADTVTRESLEAVVPAADQVLEVLVPYHQQRLRTLSPGERRLVVALGTQGEMPVAQAATLAELDPKTTATMLRRLHETGLVDAGKSPEGDQRFTYYRLRDPMLRAHLRYRSEALGRSANSTVVGKLDS